MCPSAVRPYHYSFIIITAMAVISKIHRRDMGMNGMSERRRAEVHIHFRMCFRDSLEESLGGGA